MQQETEAGERSETAQNNRFTCRLAGYLAASAAVRVRAGLALHGRKASLAKLTQWIGIYLAHTGAGLPLGTVAFCFGRNRKTVSRACSLIEDWRDDAIFDAELIEVEALLRMACGIGARGISQ